MKFKKIVMPMDMVYASLVLYTLLFGLTGIIQGIITLDWLLLINSIAMLIGLHIIRKHIIKIEGIA